ncbi:MAG: hypothetical protein ACRDRG_02950 [Pseudonocardiaceae bacterium]
MPEEHLPDELGTAPYTGLVEDRREVLLVLGLLQQLGASPDA